jgi:hypothetical protein
MVAHSAAASGNVQLLQWLREDVQLLQWLREQGIEFDELSMGGAALAGNMEVCQFLRAQGCAWSTAVTTAAAEGDQLEALLWLRREGCPWDPRDALLAAASADSRHVLVHTINTAPALLTQPLLTDMLAAAGAGGHLQTAQLLRSHLGAQWPAVLHFDYMGNLMPVKWPPELVDWARSEGCTSPLQ